MNSANMLTHQTVLESKDDVASLGIEEDLIFSFEAITSDDGDVEDSNEVPTGRLCPIGSSLATSDEASPPTTPRSQTFFYDFQDENNPGPDTPGSAGSGGTPLFSKRTTKRFRGSISSPSTPTSSGDMTVTLENFDSASLGFGVLARMPSGTPSADSAHSSPSPSPPTSVAPSREISPSSSPAKPQRPASASSRQRSPNRQQPRSHPRARPLLSSLVTHSPPRFHTTIAAYLPTLPARSRAAFTSLNPNVLHFNVLAPNLASSTLTVPSASQTPLAQLQLPASSGVSAVSGSPRKSQAQQPHAPALAQPQPQLQPLPGLLVVNAPLSVLALTGSGGVGANPALSKPKQPFLDRVSVQTRVQTTKPPLVPPQSVIERVPFAQHNHNHNKENVQ